MSWITSIVDIVSTVFENSAPLIKLGVGAVTVAKVLSGDTTQTQITTLDIPGATQEEIDALNTAMEFAGNPLSAPPPTPPSLLNFQNQFMADRLNRINAAQFGLNPPGRPPEFVSPTGKTGGGETGPGGGVDFPKVGDTAGTTTKTTKVTTGGGTTGIIAGVAGAAGIGLKLAKKLGLGADKGGTTGDPDDDVVEGVGEVEDGPITSAGDFATGVDDQGVFATGPTPQDIEEGLTVGFEDEAAGDPFGAFDEDFQSNFTDFEDEFIDFDIDFEDFGFADFGGFDDFGGDDFGAFEIEDGPITSAADFGSGSGGFLKGAKSLVGPLLAGKNIASAITDPGPGSIIKAGVSAVSLANHVAKAFTGGVGFLSGTLGTIFSGLIPILSLIPSIIAFSKPFGPSDTEVAQGLLDKLAPGFKAIGITNLANTRTRTPFTAQMEPFSDVFGIPIASMLAGSAGETERKGSSLAGLITDNLALNNASTEQIQGLLMGLLGPDVKTASEGFADQVLKNGFTAFRQANRTILGSRQVPEQYFDTNIEDMQTIEDTYTRGINSLEQLYGEPLENKQELLQDIQGQILEKGKNNRARAFFENFEDFERDNFGTREDGVGGLTFALSQITGIHPDELPGSTGLMNKFMRENPEIRQQVLDFSPEQTKALLKDMRESLEIERE